jgi:hypothetical protein
MRPRVECEIAAAGEGGRDSVRVRVDGDTSFKRINAYWEVATNEDTIGRYGEVMGLVWPCCG